MASNLPSQIQTAEALANKAEEQANLLTLAKFSGVEAEFDSAFQMDAVILGNKAEQSTCGKATAQFERTKAGLDAANDAELARRRLGDHAEKLATLTTSAKAATTPVGMFGKKPQPKITKGTAPTPKAAPAA